MGVRLRPERVIDSAGIHTSPSEDRVTPAFDGVRRRAPLGVRLEGRTGNFPSSGLSPDQFTPGSEAARSYVNWAGAALMRRTWSGSRRNRGRRGAWCDSG